jgi:hypothetical protein
MIYNITAGMGFIEAHFSGRSSNTRQQAQLPASLAATFARPLLHNSRRQSNSLSLTPRERIRLRCIQPPRGLQAVSSCEVPTGRTVRSDLRHLEAQASLLYESHIAFYRFALDPRLHHPARRA